jgi:biopolymer transport protein ExbD
MRTLIALMVFTAMATPLQAKAQVNNPKVELVHQPCDKTTAARVFVSADGVVSLNGNATPIGSLLAALMKLSIQSVCYSRENPQAPEPHPVALQALDAIMQLKLPVAFYWDADFQQRVHIKR